MLRNRKKSTLPSLIALIFVSAGVIFVRFLLMDGKTAFAVSVSIILTATYTVFRMCVNYRLQVQTVIALYGGETKIKAKEYISFIRLSVRLFLLKTAELIAFEFLPFLMISALLLMIRIKGISANACIIILVGVAVIAATGLIFYVFSVQKYSKAQFFLAAYPNLSVGDCIALSLINCKEKAAELLRFKLGFLPWIPLCIAIFPLLYFIPYYKQSLTCRYVTQGF